MIVFQLKQFRFILRLLLRMFIVLMNIIGVYEMLNCNIFDCQRSDRRQLLEGISSYEKPYTRANFSTTESIVIHRLFSIMNIQGVLR